MSPEDFLLHYIRQADEHERLGWVGGQELAVVTGGQLSSLRPQPAEQAARPPGQITDGQGRTAGSGTGREQRPGIRGCPAGRSVRARLR